MKTLTVIEPGKIKLLNTPKPEIHRPNQVLVRIKAAGICGSDIHIMHGTNPYAKYPRVIGHEAAGEVEATGTGVKDLKPGDGVVFEPITYCGACYACRSGHHNVCRKLNVLGCTTDGVFQEYVVVDRSQVYPFSTEKMNFAQAALCEPYTIGMQANWRGKVKKDDIVLIHGAGPIGLIVADIANAKGAEVIVSEPREDRLAMAEYFGARHRINPRNTDLDDFIEKETKGEGVNVIIDACGAPGIITQATRLLSPAGRLVAMTYGQEPIPIDFREVNAKELTILGTRHQYQKFPETIEQFPGHLRQIDRLTTHRLPVEEYEHAFELLEDRNSKAGKIVLTF